MPQQLALSSDHRQPLAVVGSHQFQAFNNYPLVLQAAMSGQGVALGWLPLVQDLLAGGQLVSLADAPVTTPRGYFLVLRESTRLTGVIGRFRRWAREVCANAPQEQGGAGGTSAIG